MLMCYNRVGAASCSFGWARSSRKDQTSHMEDEQDVARPGDAGRAPTTANKKRGPEEVSWAWGEGDMPRGCVGSVSSGLQGNAEFVQRVLMSNAWRLDPEASGDRLRTAKGTEQPHKLPSPVRLDPPSAPHPGPSQVGKALMRCFSLKPEAGGWRKERRFKTGYILKFLLDTSWDF